MPSIYAVLAWPAESKLSLHPHLPTFTFPVEMQNLFLLPTKAQETKLYSFKRQ